MKYHCSKCRSPVKEGDKTCSKCGEELVWRENFRKLSIVSLLTGIVSPIIFPIPFFLVLLFALDYWKVNLSDLIIYLIIFCLIPLTLSTTSITCGSIDLKRIKSSLYSRKGRGFDITGITLGIIFFLFYIPFAFYIIIDAMLLEF